MNIKKLLPEHWEAVKKIYELGISTGLATFETEIPTWEEWDKNHLPHSRLICEIDERVAGWAAIVPSKDFCASTGVAELSIYIHSAFKRSGIGFVLMNHLINHSEENGIWTLQASIFEGNKGSLRLHEKSRFRKVGFREKFGKLNGEWHNIILFEKRSKTVGL